MQSEYLAVTIDHLKLATVVQPTDFGKKKMIRQPYKTLKRVTQYLIQTLIPKHLEIQLNSGKKDLVMN